MEKNPNFELNLGLWLLQFGCLCLLSVVDTGTAAGGVVSLSLGIDVQKALLHPVTIAAANIFRISLFCLPKRESNERNETKSFYERIGCDCDCLSACDLFLFSMSNITLSLSLSLSFNSKHKPSAILKKKK